MVDAFKAGKTLAEIAADHGTTPNAVRKRLTRAGAREAKPVIDRRAAIRRAVRRGDSPEVIARDLGIKLRTARDYLTYYCTSWELAEYWGRWVPLTDVVERHEYIYEDETRRELAARCPGCGGPAIDPCIACAVAGWSDRQRLENPYCEDLYE